jgi:hypothetical protein
MPKLPFQVDALTTSELNECLDQLLTEYDRRMSNKDDGCTAADLLETIADALDIPNYAAFTSLCAEETGDEG